MAKIVTDAKKAIKESNKIIKSVDNVADNIKKESEKIKDQAIDESIDVNGEKTPFRASSLVAKDVDSNLNKVIQDTEKDFKDFINETQRYLAANFAINLTKKDLEVIAKKGSAITQDLVNNTDILNNDIQEILTQNLAKGISQKQLIKQLKDLYPAYARNASTIINTGLSRLFIDINVSKFRESNFNWYIWAGPDDAITRDIPCKHWVWHRFPASQLSTISSVRMQLWNCRHSIIPISDDEKGKYPIGNLSFAA